MKKLLLTLALTLGAVAAYAQGTVTFANAAATAITNVTSAQTGGLPPYPRATVTVGLYGSTSLGLGDDTSLTLIGAVGSTFTPGLFSLGTRNFANPGDTVTLQVRAWSGAFATYEAAYAAALNDGVTLVGKSTKWEQITGGGTNPAQPITGAGRLTQFNVQTLVPEPSSIALGLLGLGAVALFRRKK
jgi:PEP-CTERM motif